MSPHAVLSPSAAHRWLSCTPSALLELEFPDSAGVAAAEGTAAHALAEHKLRRWLKMPSKRPVSNFEDDDMDTHTDSYVSFVQETLAEVRQGCPDAVIALEQRLDYSAYVPDGFGTGDCVIVADGLMHVIDFKYGKGVIVEAFENPQMMLYALGALTAFGMLYDITEVSMTIFQPRRENVSTFTLTTEALMSWADTYLVPRAKLAAAGEGEYVAGEHCQFCRAAARCRARSEQSLAVIADDFGLPPVLTDDEIAAILPKVDQITSWAKTIWDYAYDSALNQGKAWPGYKLVEGRSDRRFIDEDAVAKAAMKAGYKDIYTKKLLGIGALEKLMGRKEFSEVLGGYVTKPAGKPTLVPEDDRRAALGSAASAQADFREE